jgi:hypothetical protein
MQFTQTGPTTAVREDGATVEMLADRSHLQLISATGTWIVEVALAADDDWFAVTVFPDTLLRSGGALAERDRAQALEALMAGLRALRVRAHAAAPAPQAPLPPGD